MKIAKLLVLGLIITFAACTKNSKENDDRIEFETFEYDLYTNQMVEDSDSALWHKQCIAVLPVKIGDADITALKDTLLAMCNSQFDAEKRFTCLLDSTENLLPLTPDDHDKASFSNSSLFIKLITKNVIVWENFSDEYFFGAAHGMYSSRFLNYSLEDHKILTLNDIMKKGFEPELISLLREKLSSNDNLLVSLNEIGIPSQYYITPNGLTFVYALYEIAPYSAGEISVDFSSFELEEVLSEEGMELINNYFKYD